MMMVVVVVILVEDVGGEARVTGTLLDSWDARCGRLAWQGRPDWERENDHWPPSTTSAFGNWINPQPTILILQLTVVFHS